MATTLTGEPDLEATSRDLVTMKAMTVVRVCLAVAALAVFVLLFASARPSPDFESFAALAIVVSVAALVAYVGALARRSLVQATGVDITWPLLLLSLLIFSATYSGLLTPFPTDGCYTVESATEAKSFGFKLWVAWSTLGLLGLGAAISRNDSLSTLATWILPLAIVVIAVSLVGLALGDAILCPEANVTPAAH